MSATAAGTVRTARSHARPILRSTTTLWLLWALTRLYGLVALHGFFPYQRTWPSNTDISLYFLWSRAIWGGAVPYVAFAPVYPPGMLPIIALPPSSSSMYQAEFFLTALAVDALVMRGLLRSGRSGGAVLWIVAAPLLGPIFWSRLDIFVAGMLVAGVLAFERGRFEWASVWFAWAGLVKIWPLLLLVVLLPLVPRHRRRSFIIPSLCVCAIAVIPFVTAGGAANLWHVVDLQAGRGVELESLFALPLYALRALGGVAPVVLSASYQFAGSADWTVAAVSTVLLAAAVGYCVWRAVLRPPKNWGATQWLLLIVGLLLLTDRVLSPQYLVWVAAAVALFIGRTPRRRLLTSCTVLLLVATQLQFPFGFRQLVLVTAEALPLSAVHAAALLLFVAVALHLLHTETRMLSPTPRDVEIGDRLASPPVVAHGNR